VRAAKEDESGDWARSEIRLSREGMRKVWRWQPMSVVG
jgi:hypothetical protein